jgi:hypothetical protein
MHRDADDPTLFTTTVRLRASQFVQHRSDDASASTAKDTSSAVLETTCWPPKYRFCIVRDLSEHPLYLPCIGLSTFLSPSLTHSWIWAGYSRAHELTQKLGRSGLDQLVTVDPVGYRPIVLGSDISAKEPGKWYWAASTQPQQPGGHSAQLYQVGSALDTAGTSCSTDASVDVNSSAQAGIVVASDSWGVMGLREQR